MKDVIKRVVPPTLKRKVRSFVEGQIRVDRMGVLKQIPRYDLAAKHVAHLEVVATRAEMLARLAPHAVAAEIGVSRGKFTAAIMAANPPRKLHLVDVWASERYDATLENTVMRTYADAIASGAVEINKGYSTAVGGTFPEGYFDWIYIDTDHSYETTRDELALYAPKMKPGGVIAGHDYAMGNWRDGIKYGVIEAVHEFCVKHDWELVHVTTELTTNPSFAIRKIGR